MKAVYNLADLKNSGAPQSEIEKPQAKVRNSEIDFTKERADYNKRYPSERYQSNTRADFEEVEDDEGPETFDERKRIDLIKKQNDALKLRTFIDRYISENPKQAPERREAAKKDWKQIKQLMKETRKKKRSF